jgi:hypothetical protein
MNIGEGMPRYCRTLIVKHWMVFVAHFYKRNWSPKFNISTKLVMKYSKKNGTMYQIESAGKNITLPTLYNHSLSPTSTYHQMSTNWTPLPHTLTIENWHWAIQVPLYFLLKNCDKAVLESSTRDLTKSGNKWNMNVKTFKPSILLATYWNLIKNLAIFWNFKIYFKNSQ